MQQSKLSILVDEKKVNDLLKSKSGAKAFIRSFCNLLFFLGFLILYTFLALGEPLKEQRAMEEYLRRRFDFGSGMPLYKINSIAKVYEYMNNTVLPGLYGNDTAVYYYPGYEINSWLSVDHSSSSNNKLLGLARVRQLKVLPKQDCKVQENFRSYFPDCYGSFSLEAEDTEEYGPVAAQGGKEFQYGAAAANGAEYTGQLGITYPASGFMQSFTANYSRSVEVLGLLQDAGWLSAATRVVFIEFTIYNYNTGFYGVCRIALEASPSGAWLKNFDVNILQQRDLQPLGDQGASAWALLVMQALLVCCVVRYIFEETSEFIGCDNNGSKNILRRMRIKTEYFSDGWNLIDWGNLILIITVMGYRISTWGKGGDAVSLINEEDYLNMDPSTFVDMNGVVENVRHIRNIQAFNAVLTWFKAVKYITIIPFTALFVETVNISSSNLIGFAAVFFTSFIGFCLAYSTAFGEQLSVFRTPPRAFVFLMRSFLGNADMSIVYNAAPFLGSCLIFLFILGMIFVILNLFYAIMISALSDARQTQDMKASKDWQRTVDKVQGFWETVSRVLALQQRFRSCFPGLHSRLNTRRKKLEAKEELRDMQARARARQKAPQQSVEEALGPASPNAGRRKKRTLASAVNEQEDEGSDVGSEPDIGPISKDRLLRTKYGWDSFGMMALQDEAGGATNGVNGETPGGMPFGNIPPEEDELNDEAIDLVLEATGHVVKGIKDRCRGARSLVLSEMKESKEVLQGIGNVLEVLGRRVRSLEAQQLQLLPPPSRNW